MSHIRVFLSYNSSDKKLAGGIKRQLEKFGPKVFLAHEDIEPTQDWIRRILRELDKTDVMLPILTDNFPRSKWTDQECGIAKAKGAFIISTKVTINPYGFLASEQAFKFRLDNVPLSCLNIAKVIHKNRKLPRRFLDGLIQTVADSHSYDEAGVRASYLNEFEGYSARQVNEMLRAAVNNDQIYRSFIAKRHLATFCSIHRDKIEESTLKALRRVGL